MALSSPLKYLFKSPFGDYRFTESQRLNIKIILDGCYKSENQINSFIDLIQSGVSYYLSRCKTEKLSEYSASDEHGSVEDIKEAFERLSNSLKNIKGHSRSVINCNYFMREKKFIYSPDGSLNWDLSLTLLADDIALSCDEYLKDSDVYLRQRGYRLELYLVDSINFGIEEYDIDLSILIGGNTTTCGHLMNYLVELLEIKGNNNKPARGHGIISKWLSKNDKKVKEKITKDNHYKSQMSLAEINWYRGKK